MNIIVYYKYNSSIRLSYHIKIISSYSHLLPLKTEYLTKVSGTFFVLNASSKRFRFNKILNMIKRNTRIKYR